MILFRDVRLKQSRRQFSMIGRRKCVADIMQQRANHIFVISAITLGTCCRLQAVFKPRHRKSAMVVFQKFKMRYHPIGQVLQIGRPIGFDRLPVFSSALG